MHSHAEPSSCGVKVEFTISTRIRESFYLHVEHVVIDDAVKFVDVELQNVLTVDRYLWEVLEDVILRPMYELRDAPVSGTSGD